MSNTRRKVFAFGIDAPNNDLLLDWQQRGLLPNQDIELCHVARFWPQFRLVARNETCGTAPESTTLAFAATEDPRRSRLPSPVLAGGAPKA